MLLPSLHRLRQVVIHLKVTPNVPLLILIIAFVLQPLVATSMTASMPSALKITKQERQPTASRSPALQTVSAVEPTVNPDLAPHHISTKPDQTSLNTTKSVLSSSGFKLLSEQVGLWLTGIRFADLNRVLQRAQVAQTGETFIVERSGKLVTALPQSLSLNVRTEQPYQPVINQSATGQPVTNQFAINSRNSVIQQTAQQILQRYGSFQNVLSQQHFSFSLQGSRHYVQITPYSNQSGVDWLIVASIPISVLADPLGNVPTSLLGLVLLGTIVTTAFYLSRKLPNSVVHLGTVNPKNDQSGSHSSHLAMSALQEPAAGTPGQAAQECLQQALEAHSQALEQKVYERTKALEAEIRRRIAIEEILHRANQQLEQLAFIDGLTQVANRRHFDNRLIQEWWRLRRIKAPLSIILCDIDYFKQYNDTYGHQAGDECLRKVASALQTAIKRPADLVARYGGEEFVIILPDTPTIGAIQVAEKIQMLVEQLQLCHQSSLVKSQITLSLGVVTSVPQAGNNPMQLIATADQALYQAKAKGRNCLVVNKLPVESRDLRLVYIER